MSVTLKDVGFDEVDDPVVRKELEAALDAAMMSGGRRRMRGAGPTKAEREAAALAASLAARRAAPAAAAPAPGNREEAARQVSTDAVKSPEKLRDKVETVLRGLAAPTAAVGATVVAVNNPGLLANLAEVIAVSLAEITDFAVTSTWSEWGQAVLGIGRAIGVIGKTGTLQAFHGPVVPFAIATAIMTWRAQKLGKSLFQQLKDDAAAVPAAAVSAAAAAAASVKKAVKPDPMVALFELADRARRIKIAGAGAEELKDLVRTELRGLPAVRPTPAGIGLVPGSAPRDPGAPLKAIAAMAAPPGMGATTAKASAAIASYMEEDAALARLARPKRKREDDEEEDADGAMVPGPKRQELEGGRRRKTKKRKAKRRTTRRRVATVVKFAY